MAKTPTPPRHGAATITMAEVAKRAGVSTMTVSRALRQPDAVTPDLRKRVETAIRETGYIHNLVASSLASRRSGTIAVILPTIASSIFSDTVRGIGGVARRYGAQLVLAETNYDLAEEHRAVAALLGRRVDGLIVVGVSHLPETRKLLSQSGLPVVETWDTTRTPIDSIVALSNFSAAKAMTATLLGLGYRRIAFIGAAQRDRRAEMRRKGYTAALLAHGVTAPLVYYVNDIRSMASGVEAAEQILRSKDRPDAVFCLNDVVAAGTMFALQRKNLSVPGDIAVAGFGGFDFAQHLIPALTTVDVHHAEIGERAAQILFDRISGATKSSKREDTDFEISIRESVGTAAPSSE